MQGGAGQLVFAEIKDAFSPIGLERPCSTPKLDLRVDAVATTTCVAGDALFEVLLLGVVGMGVDALPEDIRSAAC